MTQSCQHLESYMHYLPGCRFRNQYIHRILHKQFFFWGGGTENEHFRVNVYELDQNTSNNEIIVSVCKRILISIYLFISLYMYTEPYVTVLYDYIWYTFVIILTCLADPHH